jgi:hypothetical protein
VDDNGTPDDTSDDVPIPLSGLTDLDGDGTADDLAVGATATGTYEYTITAEDNAAAQHSNLATGTATDPNGDPVTDEDPETVPLPQQNQCSIQLRDIWGVDVAGDATVGTSYSPTSGKNKSNLVCNGNMI